MFFRHELCSNKRILKKREQILEEELKALSVDYLERTIEEMLPSRMVAVGISIFVVKWKNL